MKKEKGDIFNLHNHNKKLGIGSILVSEPLLQDYFFRRAVVIILDYNEKGALGVVLNKPIYIDINEVLSDFSAKPFPLYSGGPVAIERLFFLHQLGDVISESEKIIEGVFWSGNENDLASYFKNPTFDESKIRAFLGYSGWEPGQLEKEIESGSWAVTDLNHELIFNDDSTLLWNEVVKTLAEDFHIWLNFPNDPLLN